MKYSSFYVFWLKGYLFVYWTGQFTCCQADLLTPSLYLWEEIIVFQWKDNDSEQISVFFVDKVNSN